MNDSCEITLSEVLAILNRYFKYWILKSNPSKTETTLFYLNNKMVNHKISVLFGNRQFKKQSELRKPGIRALGHWVER